MLLSIITINYNNALGLRKTVESVLTQSIHDFEYIVVDGASTDGSVEYLSNNCQLSTVNCKFISEADKGIYHAMNKGIRMASGEYVHFLNSGDWLVDNFVVENMLKLLKSQSSIIDYGTKAIEGLYPLDILVGNVITVRPDGKVRYGKNNTSQPTALTFYWGTIEHTSAYIRRALFDTIGMYDEQLKIVSDWKWYLDAVVNHSVKVAFADMYVSYFDSTGISSMNKLLDKQERRKVLEDALPAAILADYDKYHFAIEQHERIKKHFLLNMCYYLIERVIFKFEKWRLSYWGWR